MQCNYLFVTSDRISTSDREEEIRSNRQRDREVSQFSDQLATLCWGKGAREIKDNQKETYKKICKEEHGTA